VNVQWLKSRGELVRQSLKNNERPLKKTKSKRALRRRLLQEATTAESRFSRKSIERKLGEYRRILTLTRRPTREEYSNIAKVAAIGIIIIGVGGFLIYLAMVQAPQSLGLTNNTTATATPSNVVNTPVPVSNATQNSSITSAVNKTGNATT
jgi:protein transport protein SEC61 subunit gamma-like protein